MYEGLNYSGDKIAAEQCGQVEAVSASMLTTLQTKKTRLQMKLDEVDTAIKALESNPEILRVLDLLAKANRG